MLHLMRGTRAGAPAFVTRMTHLERREWVAPHRPDGGGPPCAVCGPEETMEDMDFTGVDVIRVFEHDPDLLAGLEPGVAAHLRTRAGARRLWAERGRWEPRVPEAERRGHLGMLVIDGLLVRTLSLAGRPCSEVIGPGDLVRPWDGEDVFATVAQTSRWRALCPATFAVLDARFAALINRWPTITAQLLARSVRRCRALAVQAAIANVRHAETRVLLALWSLADRWGRVTTDGVVVPVPLTHQLVAHITSLQRPTASAAIGHLRRDGRLSRRDDGCWVLHGDPPARARASAVVPGCQPAHSARRSVARAGRRCA
jgi:CRP/FNR family transcriptional regulator, cyclic AMP receptor protein